MKLIVGLGNPGSAYLKTRHNVGFLAAERLSQRWKIPLNRKGCSALFGEGKFGECPVRLALPQTFMNASGESVACLLSRWKIKPPSVLVVCDDLSLPLGMIRLRGKGSAGGHLGLGSILERLGTEEVARLRIGIRSEQPGKDLTPYVLGRFAPAEGKTLEQGLASAEEACELWMDRGINAAMNRFNQKVKERE